MLLNPRRVRWSGAAAILLVLQAGVLTTAHQTGGEWTGTVTVERRASGTLRADDGATYIGFTGRQVATYTLHGDGTASWQSNVSTSSDMGGLFAIPVTGSGFGFGYGGAAFDGQSWDIAVEAVDGVPVRTDYTAHDRAWEQYSIIALLKEMAAAMGQPVGNAGPRVEQGEFGVPGAIVTSRGGADATTLSGSVSETVQSAGDLGGPPTVPMTFTVTWNLKKGPPRSAVKIYGPECGCLDPDADKKILRFIAGASPAGGEFSEFIVTPTGQSPEVLSNTGGEQPMVELEGTKDTGPVTLKIRYRRNGSTTESAPFTVEFCAIDTVKLADGDQRDLAFDLDGKLLVDATAQAWQGGRDVSADLQWELEEMGSPTSLTAEPSDRKGQRVKFTYTGMPGSNSDFGPKIMKVKTTGKCVCEREETVRAFYPDIDSNHPDDATPNWFYYWKQTAAVPADARALLRYEPVVTDPNLPGSPLARYDHSTGRILIGDAVFGPGACRGQVDGGGTPTGRKADGIDCFGETVRHELQHRADAVSWWGSPAGPFGVNLLEWFLKDWDHDQVPNTVEEGLPGCKPGEWTNAPIDLARVMTLRDDLVERGKRTWFTCTQRPFSDVTDAEINAYTHGWTWPVGSANREDWSCGELSKQWTGKRCGA